MKIKDMKNYLKDGYYVKNVKLKEGLNLEVINQISIVDKIDIIENVIETFYDFELGIFDKYTFEIFKPYLIAKFYINNFKMPTIVIEDDRQDDYKTIYDMFYNTDAYEQIYEIIKEDFERLLDLIEIKYLYLEDKNKEESNVTRSLAKLLNKFANMTPEDVKEYENIINELKKDDFVKQLVNINSK